MDSTDKLISIDVIESILTDEDMYLDFINQSGDFFNIDIEEYISAINNYMSYITERTSDVDEQIFVRANDINYRYGVDIKHEYLLYMLNTTRIINISIIEDILNNDEVFNKFMNYHENINFFGNCLIDYLASIWEYVSFMKERNLMLSNEALDRYNSIVREYSLDYKRASILSGEYIEDEMNDKFANDILKSIDLNGSKFEVALAIYKELCKRCSYDPLFYALGQDLSNPVSADIYNRSASKINKKSTKVVCKTWAILYQNLLNRCGFNAKVDGSFHKYVIFDCDGTVIKADGTNMVKGRKDDFLLNDLTRCKLGMPVSGFQCLEADKNIDKYLEDYDEITVDFQNNLTDLSNEYRCKYMNKNNLSFNQALDLLNEKAKNSDLEDTELVKYIDSLYRIMLKPFDNVQKESHYIVFSKGRNKVEVSYLIAFINENGEYNYYVFNKGRGFKKVNQSELMKMINTQKINIPGKNKEILGIKEDVINGYVK